MTQIIKINKKDYFNFINESIDNYRHAITINSEIEQRMEEEGDLDPIDYECYLLGIDLNGNLIYTESALQSQEDDVVFFQTLDEDFAEQIEDSIDLFTNQKYLSYLKEIIEIKFKNKGCFVEVVFQ